LDPNRIPVTDGASAPLEVATGAPAGVRLLRSAAQIQQRVRELGLVVARDYQGLEPLFVGVLKGACMFQCDLARATALEVELDFLSVSSYGRELLSNRPVRLLSDLRADIAGRHVLLCEGVVDSGRSLSFVLELLRSRRPASLRVATLLDKRPCRQVDVPLDYVGWKVAADFLVGYGLDAAERYRNLPFVGVLEEK
jgi:hypoxanthine phosphoribosyltransferase